MTQKEKDLVILADTCKGLTENQVHIILQSALQYEKGNAYMEKTKFKLEMESLGIIKTIKTGITVKNGRKVVQTELVEGKKKRPRIKSI